MNNKYLKPVLFSSALILLTACGSDDDDDASSASNAATASALLDASTIPVAESNNSIDGVWLVTNAYSGTESEEDKRVSDGEVLEKEDNKLNGVSSSIVTAKLNGDTITMTDCDGNTDDYTYDSDTRKATYNHSDATNTENMEINFGEALISAQGSFDEKHTFLSNYTDGAETIAETEVFDYKGSLAAKKISHSAAFTLPNASVALTEMVTESGHAVTLPSDVTLNCFSVSTDDIHSDTGFSKDDDNNWNGKGKDLEVLLVGTAANGDSVEINHDTYTDTGSVTEEGKTFNYSCSERDIDLKVASNYSEIEYEVCKNTDTDTILGEDDSEVITNLALTKTKASATVTAKGDVSDSDYSEIKLNFSVDL